jgi:hypothetical protein
VGSDWRVDGKVKSEKKQIPKDKSQTNHKKQIAGWEPEKSKGEMGKGFREQRM